jgi:hypothetical protein
MPSGKSYLNFIYINVAFLLYICGVFYYSQVAEIKANWANVRCNPIYMPFADDITSNFTYCIQSMQSNYMGYMLEPLTYLTGSMGSLLGNFMEEINLVRAMFDKVRTFISAIIQSVFGVFLNLVIEFQKITIGIMDLIGKTVGIMTALMYTLDGSIKTMNSAWNGPMGQSVIVLSKCFHPSTQLALHNGKHKLVQIKDIKAGDILHDGNKVIATMIIDNNKNSDSDTVEPLLVIPKAGENNSDIYVTGSHYVYEDTTKKYVQVKHYKKALKQDNVKSDYYVCLITENHTIQIGDVLFWDWEDYLLSK